MGYTFEQTTARNEHFWNQLISLNKALIMRTFKIICIVFLLVLAAVFTYQNTAVMQINFFFWSVSMSACLMLLITLFLGIIIGLLLSLLNTRRKSRKAKEGYMKSLQ
jgi:uncharacterized integral membrane protein